MMDISKPVTYEEVLRYAWDLPAHVAKAGAMLLGLRLKIREYFPPGHGMNDSTGANYGAPSRQGLRGSRNRMAPGRTGRR